MVPFLNVTHGERPNANLPSFWEFAQSVIIKLNMDEHWKPMFQYCSVCDPTQMKLNPFILKFENLKEEQPAFLQEVGWNDKINQSMKLNVNPVDGMTSEEITQLYFSNLSENDVMNLYKVYQYDFLLFDYSFTTRNISVP